MSQMNRAVHGSSFSGLREEEILSRVRLRLEGRLKTRKMEARMNSPPRALDRGLMVLLAVAVFAGAGTIHYQTPMLAAFAAEFHVVGATACFAQIVIPLAAEVAPPEKRGRVMGAILACLFLGILFGRMAGGLVASTLGWRWTYVGAAAMLLALVPALALWLPSTPSRTQLGYGRLLRSLAGYLRGNAALRRASAIQFLLGISYGGFWATVAPMLSMFHGFGPAKTGLMGIPGAAGILIAQPAGRWLDRRGAHPIVTAGAALVLGAFVASTALAHSGWLAVCAIAVSASCLALILQWRSRGARPSP